MRTRPKEKTWTSGSAWAWGAASALVGLGVTTPAWGTIPYTPVLPYAEGYPALGPGLIDVKDVFGKEYSHDRDHEITATGVSPDPHQLVAWDGIGGVANGQDFSSVLPTSFIELEIDAIANREDAFFNELKADNSHLIFSVDRNVLGYLPGSGPISFTVPSAGPVLLKNGNTIGGAGELSYELAVFGGVNPPDTQGVWAMQAQINGMPFPDDIDGVELWGPEPAFSADTSHFSLAIDPATVPPVGGPAVSVWNSDGTPYITLPTIAAAVTSLLGPAPTSVSLEQQLNLDALMVRDIAGVDTDFGRDPLGNGLDEIIFSIQQIADPSDPDGYYATGSELFVLNAAGVASYLAHGGHLWDHSYALANFTVGERQNGEYFALDINAIETVSEFAIPEPSSATLMLLGTAFILRRRTAPAA